MDVNKIIDSINKTGFVLEYQVARLFEENGWTIINNRYYLDEDSQKSREIDIIAYKVKEIEGTFYYTSLIISCKKSNEQIWTFLTKELVENNPNIDKYPIIDWSNNQIIRFMKERNEFKNKIKNEVENNKFVKFNYEIDEQIFAFQQIDNNSYRAINDKDIYNSIITSIKALEYERNALNIRINRDALYNFNILSVFDGEMYSLKYNGESEPEIKRRENIKYLNRHIINKTDSFFRVHFINFKSLKNYIHYYDKLHDWHILLYSEMKEEYEKLINEEQNELALELLLDEFKEKMYWSLYDKSLNKRADVTRLSFDKDKNMRINCDIKGELYENVERLVQNLNGDEKHYKKVKTVLKETYGYTGDFYFHNDALPF